MSDAIVRLDEAIEGDIAASAARRIAAAFAVAPAVAAVALGGSRLGPFGEAGSDLDVYVYADASLSLTLRRTVAGADAATAHFDVSPWEPGDLWRDGATGLDVDVIYRAPAWIDDALDRVLVRHEAALGYTSALWHSVRVAQPLFDRDGWFAALQASAAVPYPEPLRRAIVALNRPLLRDHPTSYLRQIESALARGDAVAVQHRLTALLAGLFDILFALNRQTHPGEKRLIAWVEATCPLRPLSFAKQVDAVLVAAAPPADRLVPLLEVMLDEVDRLVREDGLLD